MYACNRRGVTHACGAARRYVVAELGPRFVAEMRKMIRNKTYAMVSTQAAVACVIRLLDMCLLLPPSAASCVHQLL